MLLFMQAIWENIWKFTLEKNHTNATIATMHLFGQLPWKTTRKLTLVKNHTNATNATIHLFRLAIWGHIWKLTLEKNHTNGTNATIHLVRQAIWGHIWKFTLGKSQTNATNATMHLFGQAILEDIWKYIFENLEKSYRYNQWNFASFWGFFRIQYFKIPSGEKTCTWTKYEYFHSSIQVEDTFRNSPYPISVIFNATVIWQFEAKKLDTVKCVNLRQKLSLNKTECRILHCV